MTLYLSLYILVLSSQLDKHLLVKHNAPVSNESANYFSEVSWLGGPAVLTAGCHYLCAILFYFLRFYLFIFRGGKGGTEGNIDTLPLAHPQLGTWPATHACDLTSNQASNLLVPSPSLNPLSHASWEQGPF